MDARETVQKGLDARKNVKAAEARAERYRETVDVIRDTLFREQMSHKRARRSWLDEKAIMTGIINKQYSTIVRLREQMAAAEDQARKARQLRALIDGVKAGTSFVALTWVYDLGWMESWLVYSLMALSLFCLAVAIYNWFRNT